MDAKTILERGRNIRSLGEMLVIHDSVKCFICPDLQIIPNLPEFLEGWKWIASTVCPP